MELLLLLVLAPFLCSITWPRQQSGKAANPAQKTFATPDEALNAFITAAESYNVAELEAILGPRSEDLVASEDPVQDKNRTAAFVAKAKEKHAAVIDPKNSIPCRRNDLIRRQQSGWRLIARVIALASLFLLVNPAVWPQEQPSHHDHAGMSMPSNEPTQADIISWQHESEGNHHLVGFFIVLSGLCMLAQARKKLHDS